MLLQLVERFDPGLYGFLLRRSVGGALNEWVYFGGGRRQGLAARGTGGYDGFLTNIGE